MSAHLGSDLEVDWKWVNFIYIKMRLATKSCREEWILKFQKKLVSESRSPKVKNRENRSKKLKFWTLSNIGRLHNQKIVHQKEALDHSIEMC